MEDIYYKVVGKKNRWCSNMVLFSGIEQDEDKLKYMEKLMKTVPYKHYFPIYEKGKEVMKAPGSMGIMVFITLNCAQKFQEDYPSLLEKAIIIRVRGVGNPHRADAVRMGGGIYPEEILDWYKNRSLWILASGPPPKGTVAFDSVIVLE